MKKPVFYTEFAYIAAMLLNSMGNALMEKSDMGINMVVAPVYLTHLKLVESLPFFTFGFAEKVFQAALILITMMVVRRIKLSYFFSFCTAFLYGTLLDVMIDIAAPLPDNTLAARILLFAGGVLLCGVGVSLIFRSYISPEAYELIVKETTNRYRLDLGRFKLFYDCGSLVLGVLLSFLFYGFGHFEGVKLGTVIYAVINGPMIAFFTRLFDRFFEFRDGLGLRSFFEASAE